MKSFAHLAARLFCRPLLLQQPVIQSFGTVLAQRIAGGDAIVLPVAYEDYDDQENEAAKQKKAVAPFAERGNYDVRDMCEQYGDVAVIRVEGVIDKALTSFEKSCYGGFDLRDFDQALALAKEAPYISRVVIDFNTPGGSTIGVTESAARIRDLAQTKEVHGYTDSLCCSAGIWLASQVDRLVTTSSAIVGSIGVYIAMLDESEALKMEGYKVELIKAGSLKAMGASFKPLADEERALLQSEVDSTYDAFRAAVTANRAVPQEAMEGQWYDGAKGAAFGLFDEVTAMSLDEYVASLMLA